jgi:hypothetical protein
MTADFDELMKIVRLATRKAFFRRRRVFEPNRKASPDELVATERRIGIALPSDLRRWLLVLGYGNIDEEMSLQENWFVAIESGQLKGCSRFAQDILGNFYAFDSRGRIHVLSRSEPVFGINSESFFEFIEELVRRDYKLVDWVDTLATQRYEW